MATRQSGIIRKGSEKNLQMTNILSNAVIPIDVRKGKVFQGSVIYVAAEVAVSQLLRTIMSAPRKSFAELTASTRYRSELWVALTPH